MHRIIDITEKTLENKKVCSAVFPDIAQALDRAWHTGLLHFTKPVAFNPQVNYTD
jgi:hypothetical protein